MILSFAQVSRVVITSHKIRCPLVALFSPRKFFTTIWVDLEIKGRKYHLKVLIDTGAEVNVIKRGLLPPECIRQNKSPINMTAADATTLIGGQTGVSGVIAFAGTEHDTKVWTELRCPAHFYEANIAAQAILSYGWIASQNFVINSGRHGLGFEDDNIKLFISGLNKDELSRPTQRPSIYRVQAYTN